MQREEYDVLRPANPVALMITLFLATLAFIIILASLVANWQTFLAASPIIVKVVIVCVIIGVPGAIILLAGMKIVQWRDERAEYKAMAKRMQEKHELDLELARTRLYADDHGNRPAVIIGGNIITVPSGNFAQPVPQTYSPHIQYAKPETRITEVENEPTQIEGPAIESPTLSYCINQLEENALQVCLGVSSTTGKPFVINLLDGVHYKFIGASGMGKSCLAGAILAQVLKTNDANTLQVALLDLEHKTSRLFENQPHVAELNVGRRIVPLVATDANEVAAQLGLLHKELDRRAVMSEQELQRERFLLIYVEEFLSLQYEVDEDAKEQMLKDFSVLAVRGRKYGMYLLACAQVDYADNDLRNAKAQFRVKGAFGVVPSAAASAGFMSKDLIKQNYLAQQPGQFVLETRGCNDIMLAPVYDVKTRLARLSDRSSVRNGGTTTMSRTSTEPLERVIEPTQNGYAERRERTVEADGTHAQEVRRYKSLNWSKEQIIKQVWGASKGGGPAYKSAEAEYNAIIAQLESEGL